MDHKKEYSLSDSNRTLSWNMTLTDLDSGPSFKLSNVHSDHNFSPCCSLLKFKLLIEARSLEMSRITLKAISALKRPSNRGRAYFRRYLNSFSLTGVWSIPDSATK